MPKATIHIGDKSFTTTVGRTSKTEKQVSDESSIVKPSTVKRTRINKQQKQRKDIENFILINTLEINQITNQLLIDYDIMLMQNYMQLYIDLHTTMIQELYNESCITTNHLNLYRDSTEYRKLSYTLVSSEQFVRQHFIESEQINEFQNCIKQICIMRDAMLSKIDNYFRKLYRFKQQKYNMIINKESKEFESILKIEQEQRIIIDPIQTAFYEEWMCHNITTFDVIITPSRTCIICLGEFATDNLAYGCQNSPMHKECCVVFLDNYDNICSVYSTLDTKVPGIECECKQHRYATTNVIDVLTKLGMDIMIIYERMTQTYYNRQLAIEIQRQKALESGSIIQRMTTYISSDILTDCCPNCGVAIMRTSGCAMLTCQCKTKLCGICLESVNRNHGEHGEHVQRCVRKYSLPGGIYARDIEVQKHYLISRYIKMRRYIHDIETNVIEQICKVDSQYQIIHKLTKTSTRFNDELNNHFEISLSQVRQQLKQPKILDGADVDSQGEEIEQPRQRPQRGVYISAFYSERDSEDSDVSVRGPMAHTTAKPAAKPTAKPVAKVSGGRAAAAWSDSDSD